MVTLRDNGCVDFELYLPHAQNVCVVGDFAEAVAGSRGRGGSDGVHMTRSTEPADGWWRARVAIPEGDYAFAYLVDGQWWMPDYAAGGMRRNTAGRWTSLLSVQWPRRTAARIRAHPDREDREPRPSERFFQSVGANTAGRSALQRIP